MNDACIQREFPAMSPLTADQSLTEAVDRIYGIYDGDLAKFFSQFESDRLVSDTPIKILEANRIQKALSC